MLPTFIGIGAQRAATTWLHNCLAAHPQVFMAPGKELHFFYHHYANGLEWYRTRFADVSDELAVGEITPDYLYHDTALCNIEKDLPDVRLFAVLRNPIERAISAFELRHEDYRGLSFEAACERDPELLEKGRYHKYLSNVYRHFSRDRVKIMIYDDIGRDPGAFLDELFEFIGVMKGFRPPLMATRFNSIIYPRLQRSLTRVGLGFAIPAVKATPLGGWLRRRHFEKQREARDAGNVDRAPLAEFYRDDVLALGDLLERDFDEWLKVS